MDNVEGFYKYRIYEGEFLFSCVHRDCPGYLLEFWFLEPGRIPTERVDHYWVHIFSRCELCQGELELSEHYPGNPLSDSLVSLLEHKHYMAATVILSAIIEFSLSSLLWSALVASGLKRTEATEKTSSQMLSRYKLIQKCRELTGWPIEDIPFATRNMVPHGKGFGRDEQTYLVELVNQSVLIRQWVRKIVEMGHPNPFMPSEPERWLLFMNHWSEWLVSYISDTAKAR